jgi:hypothetical protein
MDQEGEFVPQAVIVLQIVVASVKEHRKTTAAANLYDCQERLPRRVMWSIKAKDIYRRKIV